MKDVLCVEAELFCFLMETQFWAADDYGIDVEFCLEVWIKVSIDPEIFLFLFLGQGFVVL